MYTLENEILQVTIQAKGAELSRIYHKQNGIDYLWDAKPEVWGKHSPVLFPIVGTLKDNTFFYKGASYHLSRHGFARDHEFSVADQTKASITFTLHSDAVTEKFYPFQFTFSLRYSIDGATLSVRYEVHNPHATEALLFSVGGHPAFRLPLEADVAYEDYALHFNKVENAGRWPISKDGLIQKDAEPLLQNSNVLPLSKTLFAKDALVVKHLKSNRVILKSEDAKHGLTFDFSGFPYLGLWAAPGADFLCIEPWCGIADSVDHNQQLTDKEGIIKLAAAETFSAAWSVHFF